MCVKDMHRLMKYLVDNRESGFFMKPKELWDGDLDFELNIDGQSDYGYATDLHTRKIVCSHVTK